MESKFTELNNRDKFIISRWAYSVGKPIISDAEYNALLRYMQSNYPDDEYTNRSWSSDPCPLKLLNEIGRNDLVVNVVLGDKTESIPSLNTDYDVKLELGSFQGIGTLSMKHDGWHMQVNYYNGSLVNVRTRGRVSDAINADPLINYVPQTIPAMGAVRVSCEATISKENFKFCANMFGNVSERSAVSSVLARTEYTHLLSLNAFDIFGYDLQGRCKFEVLKEWGFSTPDWLYVKNYDDILTALKELSDRVPFYKEPTDGAVFDGHKRRAIRLLAWEEPIYYSFITGYIEKYNMYRISPSLVIYPVMRGGTTQRQINITNWQRIIENDLRPGSPVAFRIASSAIADYDDDATKLVRQEYNGRWEEFMERVKADEEVKKLNWHYSLNLS